MSAVARIVAAIVSLIYLALNVWFLVYVERLRHSGCKCAEGWRRQYIEFMLVVMVLLFLTGLLFPVDNYLVGVLYLIYLGLFIAYIVITRQFIDSMVDNDCQCAQTEAFWWLGLINIIQIVLLVLSVLLVILGLLFASSGRKSTSSARRR